jgi:hypothetical protein
VGAGGLSPAFVGGAIAAAALLLVPLNLVPIAVFPPYISGRTLPAVSVIFAEDPNIMMLNDDVTVMRTKRAVVNLMKQKMQRNYRRPSLFSALWDALLDKVRAGRKKIKFVKDEIMCLRTKVEFIKMKIKQKIRENREGNRKTTTTTTTTEKVLYRITTQASAPSQPFEESGEETTISPQQEYVDFNSTEELDASPEEVRWVSDFNSKEEFEDDAEEFKPPATLDYFHTQDALDSNLLKRQGRLRRQAQREKVMNSMDDCFADMPEPKYGFRTMITLVEDKPCDLNSTCKISSETIQSRCLKSQTVFLVRVISILKYIF